MNFSPHTSKRRTPRRGCRAAAAAALCLGLLRPAEPPAFADDDAYAWQTEENYGLTGQASFQVSAEERRTGGLCFELAGTQLLKRRIPHYSLPDWSSWADQNGWAERFWRERMDFGAIGVNEGRFTPLSTKITESDWSCRVVEISCRDKLSRVGGAFLRLYATRVMPGLLVESNTGMLQFFRNSPLQPKFFAVSTLMGGVETFVEKQIASVDTAGINWMLAWFGPNKNLNTERHPVMPCLHWWDRCINDKTDCPFLFVFDEDGRYIVSTGGERTNSWLNISTSDEDATAKIAVLPLFGDMRPSPEETGRWLEELPEEIIEQCDWWAEHLAAFPYSSRETYDYDRTDDKITVSVAFKSVPLRSNAAPAAPLPPMLALALKHGFPIETDVEPHQTGCMTLFGPFTVLPGRESCSFSVRGLAKYVLQSRVPGAPGIAPAWFYEELEAQTRKVLEAGHLAPWPCMQKSYGEKNEMQVVFQAAGEPLYFCAQALPLLREEALKADLLAYMRREREGYMPEKIVLLPITDGTRRPCWNFDAAHEQQIQATINSTDIYALNRVVPAENVYFLSEYYRVMGEDGLKEAWPEIKNIIDQRLPLCDWASMGWFQLPIPAQLSMDGWNGLGGVIDANRWFAALVGAIRLARAAGDEEYETMLWGLFARAAALRYALGKYYRHAWESKFFDDPGPDWMGKLEGFMSGRLFKLGFSFPDDDLRQVVRMNQFGVVYDELLEPYHGKGLVEYRDITPELGRFLADFLKPEAERFVQRVNLYVPDWFAAYASARLGCEHCYNHPADSHQIFMAHAWILGRDGDYLAGRVDVPWFEKGDFYYLNFARDLFFRPDLFDFSVSMSSCTCRSIIPCKKFFARSIS